MIKRDLILDYSPAKRERDTDWETSHKFTRKEPDRQICIPALGTAAPELDINLPATVCSERPSCSMELSTGAVGIRGR